MVTIEVGQERISLEDLREGELAEQVKRRSTDGRPVCVRVHIEEAEIRLELSTPECTTGRGRVRPVRPREQTLIDLWRSRGLDETDWTIGNLIAFLKALPRYA